MSPIGGRVSPIGGRVSPVGAGNYQSAAKVVADAHAAQVQRQKALAAQQAQRQHARAKLEEEKKQLALVSTLSQNVCMLAKPEPLYTAWQSCQSAIVFITSAVKTLHTAIIRHLEYVRIVEPRRGLRSQQ